MLGLMVACVSGRDPAIWLITITCSKDLRRSPWLAGNKGLTIQLCVLSRLSLTRQALAVL
ncbi:hypothetical protein SORBI_3005G174750 [Sorghum bicolor]|uniref:Uncharacterized protein n=1 Tax=Sorghum bicolor TaxID=4558 RepID=A0A1Z5RJ38_SORBI|nr:hypothetical protein SORBI_3005G174750 [Sorghum bicolor]